MKGIEVVAYLMLALCGVHVLMLQYGVLMRKTDEPSRAMKWVGVALFLGGLARLIQTSL